MLKVAEDLIKEGEIINEFLKTLKPKDWNKNTDFKNWTPRDIIAHLHYFDLLSLASVNEKNEFNKGKKLFIDCFNNGKSSQEIDAERFKNVSSHELQKNWYTTFTSLSKILGNSDPKIRLSWFGPDMGLKMFTTARYMETWAHLQAIYDLMEQQRIFTDRIFNVATIGVKTFEWTFINRKLPIPGFPPFLRLKAPSGEIWEWNKPSKSNSIEGDALDFCFVVTQVRNVADTTLNIKGQVANKWLSIAQCFAGPPVNPPKPGTRGIKFQNTNQKD